MEVVSGKSNLMDAISFVLGVKSAQLRSSQLKDLIYRGRTDSDSEIYRPKKAFVTAVIDSDAGELHFTRT